MESYLIAISIGILIYMLMALGLSLHYGFTGLVNFGHVGFFAIGSYTSALLALQGVPIPLAMAGATLLTALAAWPLGIVALRLGSDYLAIVTLGFSESVRMMLQSEEWLTRGMHGLPGIPRMYEGWVPAAQIDLAIMLTLLVVNGAVFWLVTRVVKSPFGRV
ncbi:MAG: branched-chain amino acid ABC transporter permease, partial [Achromobacter mucicolens]